MRIRGMAEWKEEVDKTKWEIISLAMGQDSSLFQNRNEGWLKRNIVKLVVYGSWALMLGLALYFKWWTMVASIAIIFAMQGVINLYQWIKQKWKQRKEIK